MSVDFLSESEIPELKRKPRVKKRIHFAEPLLGIDARGRNLSDQELGIFQSNFPESKYIYGNNGKVAQKKIKHPREDLTMPEQEKFPDKGTNLIKNTAERGKKASYQNNIERIVYQDPIEGKVLYPADRDQTERWMTGPISDPKSKSKTSKSFRHSLILSEKKDRLIRIGGPRFDNQRLIQLMPQKFKNTMLIYGITTSLLFNTTKKRVAIPKKAARLNGPEIAPNFGEQDEFDGFEEPHKIKLY